MEHRTENDLDNRVAEWKTMLSTNPNITADNVLELEDHLLDEIAELQKLDLSETEAFLVATNRIGSIKDISKEFSKVNRREVTRNRLMIYLEGILFFIAFTSIAEFLVHSSLFLKGISRFQSADTSMISIAVLVLWSVVVAFFLYFRNKSASLKIKPNSSIPILVGSILLVKVLYFVSVPMSTRLLNPTNFGILQLNLAWYNVGLVILILALATFLFFWSRKRNVLSMQ